MKINLIAKTNKGKEALVKLSKEKTLGVAKKKIISEEPMTVQVKPRGLGALPKGVFNQPQVKSVIMQTLEEMMGKYEATKKDYDIEVV